MTLPLNEVIHGDCLAVMKGLPSGSIDLIYIDPPFNTGRDFGDYADKWPSTKAYLDFIRPRVKECRRLLKPTGSFWLHCDSKVNHHLRIMLDEVFGVENFRNEVIWLRTRASGKKSGFVYRFASNTDHILFYAVSPKACFHWKAAAVPYDDLEKEFPFVDGRGRYYKSSTFRSPAFGGRPNLCYEFCGIVPPHKSGWRYSKWQLEKLVKDGEVVIRPPNLYVKQRPQGGKLRGDLWDDVLSVVGANRRSYATQKPLGLLSRIIASTSNPGDVVLDAFCGSGTALVAAKQLGRRFVGIDCNPRAVALSRKRLAEIML